MTFAASFHWTDRPEVVRVLDRLLEPEGSIVTINDHLSDAEDPDWVRAITDLRGSYLGDNHTEPTDPYKTRARQPPNRLQHLDRLQLFGDHAAAFARDVRAAVLAMCPGRAIASIGAWRRPPRQSTTVGAGTVLRA